MSVADVIKQLYDGSIALIQFLDNNQEPSMKAFADNELRKVLILSAASYFETSITDLIIKFVQNGTSNNITITTFVQKKALARQYHTLFQWEGRNVNSFLGLFGDKFKDQAVDEISRNQSLQSAVHAFLEIGVTRNKLVHAKMVQQYTEKTTQEIYALYEKAHLFVEFLEQQFKNASMFSEES